MELALCGPKAYARCVTSGVLVTGGWKGLLRQLRMMGESTMNAGSGVYALLLGLSEAGGFNDRAIVAVPRASFVLLRPVRHC